MHEKYGQKISRLSASCRELLVTTVRDDITTSEAKRRRSKILDCRLRRLALRVIEVQSIKSLPGLNISGSGNQKIISLTDKAHHAGVFLWSTAQ